MADLLNIALSGMTAQRAALTVTGNNISNANTAGYSRQQAVVSTVTPAYLGGAYLGSGVQVDGIRRIADGFLTNQIRTDTSVLSQVSTYHDNIRTMDGLLANEATSLSSSMQEFFSAMQTAANDPSSVPARQVVLSQSSSLVSRFNSFNEMIGQQNTAVNSSLHSYVDQLNSLAASVAELNVQIAGKTLNGAASMPNDLLDKREEVLRQMSELASVTVVNSTDGTVNVFIGQGQGLVFGAKSATLATIRNPSDPLQENVAIVTPQGVTDISKQISGGKLGGIVQYRSDALDAAANILGRLALVVADTMNRQQQLGMDLEGNLGQNLFGDINATEISQTRIIAHANNPVPQSYAMSVSITDSLQLTDSDYELELPGPGNNEFVLTRKSDGKIIQQGQLTGSFPTTIVADGFSINLESGNFVAGSTFTVSPTKRASGDISLNLTRTQELAFAQAVRTQAATGNAGSGQISAGEVLDVTTSAFANEGALSPPLIIRFTSATTYDILDNSNPASPVPLNPPMTDRVFVPNSQNTILTTDSGSMVMRSSGALAGALQTGLTNGYPAESYSFSIVNPDTGIATFSSASSLANATAKEIAATLNTVSGVKATAGSRVMLSNFVDGGTFGLSLNGQALTGTDANSLADSINDNTILASYGIRGYSDGTTLTIRGLTGTDLQLQMGGGAGDSLLATDINGGTLAMVGGDVATVGGVVDVELPAYSTMTTTGAGVFTTNPVGQSDFLGYTFSISGSPREGDVFTVGYNTNGTADNRNALRLLALETGKTVAGGGLTFQESYAELVEKIGTLTSQAKIGTQSGQAVLDTTTAARDSVAGVNLDEEAANLIRFEQAYNASAQVIAIARQLMDTLINAVG